MVLAVGLQTRPRPDQELRPNLSSCGSKQALLATSGHSPSHSPTFHAVRRCRGMTPPAKFSERSAAVVKAESAFKELGIRETSASESESFAGFSSLQGFSLLFYPSR